MAYQPYPTGSSGSAMPGPVDRPPKPPSLINAVRLMWAGAALALLGVILTLAFSSKIRSAVTKAAYKANATRRGQGKSVLTATQIHTLGSVTISFLVVVGIIAVGLWAWMAWANNRGRNWARIVATVLFGLNTISVLLEVGRASITIIVVLIGWLVGLGAIVLLWQKQTTAYVRPR